MSEDARSLIDRMIDVDPARRITTQDALQHSWIREKQRIAKAHLPDTVEQLMRFNAKRKYKVSVHCPIPSVCLALLLDCHRDFLFFVHGPQPADATDDN